MKTIPFLGYAPKVRCIDCLRYADTRKPPICRYSGAKISGAQAKREIWCDFHEPVSSLRPFQTGWRGYGIVGPLTMPPVRNMRRKPPLVRRK